MIIFFGLIVILKKEGLGQELFDSGWYLTPQNNYSRMGRSLGICYQRELIDLANRVQQELQSQRFELLNINQSPMAGVGFWINPSIFVPETRFIGICARVNIRLDYFPDNEWGRLSSALDAFGKDLIKILGQELENIPEPSVKGAVLILIYSKAKLKDPNYYNQAEAVAIYIPRDTLKKFNSFVITYNTLFSQSEYYYFRGLYQIQILLNHFLRG